MYTKWSERECVIVWLCNSLHAFPFSSGYRIGFIILFTYTSRIILYLKWENFNRNESDGQSNAHSLSLSFSFTLSFTYSIVPFALSRSISLNFSLLGSLVFVLFHFVWTNRHTKTHSGTRTNMTHWWAFTVIYIHTASGIENGGVFNEPE